jgi:hypothetical protein
MKKFKKIVRLLFFGLSAAVLITACGRKGPDAPPNTMPDAFSFTAQTNVPLNTVVTSNSITVRGINTAAQISIIGGEYSIDGGAYTSVVGTVTDGQTVKVQLTSSATNYGFTTNAVLTIGGISGIFSVTTVTTTTTTTISAPPVSYGQDGSVAVTVSSAAGTPVGYVLLSVDSENLMSQALMSSGSTTFTIPKPSEGSHTLDAVYVPEGIFQGSSASGTLGVGAGATGMLLSAPTVTYGANGIVTVTVSSTAGTPSGNVTLSVDGGALMTQALSNGSASFTISNPNAGSYNLNASYSAQGNFAASSASGTLNVGQATTTTSVTAPGIAYGTDGSVTVSVSSTAGTPAGNVSLSVDSGAPMTQALSNGFTTFTIANPGVGTHTLIATYAAQGNFGASSASGTLGVGAGATTMLLSAPTVTYGANGIVTVTVSSTAGTPTGNVSLSVNGGAATTQQLDINGSATFTISSPNAGSYTLNASYAAQGDFGASAASGTLTVNQAATTTSIDAPLVMYGTDGTVTVTVSSTAGTPAGNVSLSVDGGPPMTQALSNGSTTFTITSPSVGSHTLSATYAAQGNFGASSASGTLGVGGGATTMLLSAPTVTYGANGIVTVTVSSAGGTPTGNVSLSINSGPATTQQLDINGSAVFTIASPSAGTYNLDAEYAAQGIFGASSASSTLTVNQASSSTGITSSPNPSTFNNSVVFTAAVSPSTATGTVTFMDGVMTLGTGTLSSGIATFSTSTLSAGVHSITANYGGDANFTASTSSVLLQTVNYAITATVGSHGTITPSGTVLVTPDSDQAFYIVASKNYSIADVKVDGVSIGPFPPGTYYTYTYTFQSVTANHTIYATFQ